jgi:hypothetical protein
VAFRSSIPSVPRKRNTFSAPSFHDKLLRTFGVTLCEELGNRPGDDVRETEQIVHLNAWRSKWARATNQWIIDVRARVYPENSIKDRHHRVMLFLFGTDRIVVAHPEDLLHMSASGGRWGEEGFLYVTGHDLRRCMS